MERVGISHRHKSCREGFGHRYFLASHEIYYLKTIILLRLKVANLADFVTPKPSEARLRPDGLRRGEGGEGGIRTHEGITPLTP